MIDSGALLFRIFDRLPLRLLDLCGGNETGTGFPVETERLLCWTLHVTIS